MAIAMSETDASARRVLDVRWADGSVSRLPYLWLRDNCDCADCRIEQTAEKRFLLSSVPADFAPAVVALDGDRLRITWPDGHVTRYDGASVRALRAPDPPAWTAWDAAFVPARFSFDAFLEDDGSAAEAIDSFLEFGAMLLVDAPTAAGTLERLAPRLGPIREVLFARIHDVQVDPRGYNVAHTPLALPPHNDFASYSWQPSVQALHMLVNDTPGGESVIVDGWRILSELRDDAPGLFNQLGLTPVPFREFDDDTETAAAEPIVRLDSGGRIAGLRFSNQLMQILPPDTPALADFYQAYHELCCRITDPAGKSTFRLEAGQILLVASHRVLHARKAFEPVGNRHLQDAYFEHDNVRNHHTVLQRRLDRNAEEPA